MLAFDSGVGGDAGQSTVTGAEEATLSGHLFSRGRGASLVLREVPNEQQVKGNWLLDGPLYPTF